MDFTGHEGWLVGYIIGLVVVLVVVALVLPILVLAWRIGNQAGGILDGLKQAEINTAGLAGLNETIASALAIIDGLKRGRTRLGG
jgi:ABC-type Fe3+ transport system permease subunit